MFFILFYIIVNILLVQVLGGKDIVNNSSSDYHKNPFFPQTVMNWNALPESIVIALSLATFKVEYYANENP